MGKKCSEFQPKRDPLFGASDVSHTTLWRRIAVKKNVVLSYILRSFAGYFDSLNRIVEQGGKFRWGVSIDDMWTYAGSFPPKSILIPHLPPVQLPQGPFSHDFGLKPSGGHRPEIPSTVAFFDLSGSQRRALPRVLSRNLARSLKHGKVDFVRCWFQWNLFQPEIRAEAKQEYQFPLDYFVDTMNASGISVIAVLGCGYYRFLPKGLDIDDPRVYLARLKDASREIVRHHSGKISMWQLENEPNWWLEHFATDWRRGRVWFQKDIQETILDALQLIVKEEDPATQTMINLESEALGKSSVGFAKYCNVLGVDCYPNYIHANPIQIPKFSKALDISKMAEIPLMITETGYPSAPNLFGFNEERQAQFVETVCDAAHSTDFISALGVWRLTDPYWFSFPPQENEFGLIDRRGSPKKAWSTFLSRIKQSH